jgi:hypothetical protein
MVWDYKVSRYVGSQRTKQNVRVAIRVL